MEETDTGTSPSQSVERPSVDGPSPSPSPSPLPTDIRAGGIESGTGGLASQESYISDITMSEASYVKQDSEASYVSDRDIALESST